MATPSREDESGAGRSDDGSLPIDFYPRYTHLTGDGTIPVFNAVPGGASRGSPLSFEIFETEDLPTWKAHGTPRRDGEEGADPEGPGLSPPPVESED